MKKSLSGFCAATTTVFLLSSSMLTAQNTAPYWSILGNNNAGSSAKLGTTNPAPLRFFTNNAERVHIDASGNVGIGTSLPVNILTVKLSGGIPAASWLSGGGSPAFMAFGENMATGFNLATAADPAGYRPVLNTRRSRGTLAFPTAVLNNDYLASFVASGYDGSNFQNPATIDFYVDGIPSPGNVPGRISFVTGSNKDNRLERLKVGTTGNFNFNNDQLTIIQATGNVGIGTNTPSSQLHVAGNGRFTKGLAVDSGGIVAASGDTFGTGVSGNGFYGVSGKGTYGVSGTGNIGVYGTGGPTGVGGVGNKYGVYGDGKEYGIYGNSDNGIGVFGVSNLSNGTGIRGEAAGKNAMGVYGSGVIGVYGYTPGPITIFNDNYAGFFAGNVGTTGNYVTVADRNLKQDIVDVSGAMDIIEKLRPKSYNFRQDGNYKLMNLPPGKNYGLIAQEVEEVLPSLVKNTRFENSIVLTQKKEREGLRSKSPDDTASSKTIGYKTIAYTQFIPILIKGIQEQQVEIGAMKKKTAEIDILKQEVAELRQMVLELKSITNGPATLTGSYLGQNNPNPVSGLATIRYYISNNVGSVKLTITNLSGQLFKTITPGNTGAGQISFNTTKFAAGAYNYSLWVDGKQVATKRMIIAR